MDSERYDPRKTLLALAIGGALAAQSAQALEWIQTPTISVASGTDSNLHLSPNNERDVTSSQLDVGTSVVGESERVRLALRPRVNAVNYSDDQERDRRNAYLDTSLAVGNDVRRFTLAADFHRDGTLQNALEGEGFTEVDADRDRTRYSFGWSALTSERGEAELTLSNEQIRYEDIPNGPLIDYDYALAAFGYTHALSESANVEFGFFGSRLGAAILTEDTDSVGLSIAFEGNLSESLEYRIGGGAYRSALGTASSDDETDTTFDASLAKLFDRWRVTMALSAGISPSAYGVLYRREGASIDVNHRFSESFEGSLRLAAGRFESDQPEIWFEDRRYASAQLNLNWRLAERLSLFLRVGRRAQEYRGPMSSLEAPRARGTFGQLGFTYQGRRS